jgi:hypothetical protein
LSEMKRYTRKLGLEDNETDGQENKWKPYECWPACIDWWCCYS